MTIYLNLILEFYKKVRAMTEYKETLNLPKTSFPMKANLANREPEIIKFWEKIDLYESIKNQKRENSFVLHDGPPYANGSLHQGHALNKILKDITVKSKLLSGFYSPFVPGWDCHGLPIEINIEKKFGKAGEKITKEEFIERCRKYAQEQVNLQRDGFIRLGIIADWKKPYLTMNFKYEADVVRALGKIIKNGHLVHGRKPVHWCTSCASALAEAEVEYKDKESFAIDVKFRISDNKQLNSKLGIELKNLNSAFIPIWTTNETWTLPEMLNKLLILQNENQKFLSRLNRQLLFTKYTVLAYIKTYDARIKILERRSNLLIPKLQKTNYKLQGLYKKVWIIQEETSTYYRYLFLVSMIIFVFLILLVFLIVYKNRKPLNKTIEKEEYDFLSSKESISVKLDLVRAYIEMEEEESAIKVLKEIMEEGNKKQKEEAKKMLDQLNKN